LEEPEVYSPEVYIEEIVDQMEIRWTETSEDEDNELDSIID
jgi:hypothetical protein